MKIEVKRPDDCWLWMGGRNTQGYGIAAIGIGHDRKRNMIASRLAYWMVNDDYDPALKVLHRCDNPPCCNPRHLRQGTLQMNAIDSVMKQRHGLAILKPEQVLEIRRALAVGAATRRELAARYKVTYWGICSIAQNKIWRHLTGEIYPSLFAQAAAGDAGTQDLTQKPKP